MALIRCKHCLGQKTFTVLQTIKLPSGSKSIRGSSEEDCPACGGEGVIRTDTPPPRYYMRQTFDDGSTAVMVRAGDVWTVIHGAGGSEPMASDDSQARDFADQSNATHTARIAATFDDRIGG